MSMTTYLLLIGVPLVLGLYAQMRVSSAFGRYKKVAATSGVTGAQAAR
jgi:Zn-dependent membrane protease YugP